MCHENKKNPLYLLGQSIRQHADSLGFGLRFGQDGLGLTLREHSNRLVML